MPMPRTFLVSNPGSSLRARADPRASSPAATRRTRQMPTWAATSKSRSREPRSLPPKAPSSFKTAVRLGFDASSAGASPNRIPASSETTRV